VHRLQFGQIAVVVPDPGNADVLDGLAGELRGDDLGARGPGGEIGRVPLVVVRTDVGVHHVADRLGGERPELGDQRSGRRRAGMRVHHQDAVVEQHHDGVAVGADGEELGPGIGEVHPRRDPAQLEQLLRRRPRGAQGGESAKGGDGSAKR
jgi:hypothetical protein